MTCRSHPVAYPAENGYPSHGSVKRDTIDHYTPGEFYFYDCAHAYSYDPAARAIEPRLALGDELRLKTAGAIAQYGNLDLAVLGQDRLAAGTVAAVARPTTGRIAQAAIPLRRPDPGTRHGPQAHRYGDKHQVD